MSDDHPEKQYSHGLSKLLYNNDPQDVNQMATSVTRMGNVQSQHINDVSARHSSDIFYKMKEFSSTTALIGQMNEAYNSNRYVGDALMGEDNRVTKLNNDLRKEIYKLQQQYLMTVYKRNQYLFKTAIFLWIAIVASIMGVLGAMMRQELLSATVTGAAIIVIMLFFAFAMSVIYSRAARRRAYHWTQFYYDIERDNKKELKCQRKKELDTDMKARIYRLVEDIKASALPMLETDEITRRLEYLRNGHRPADLPEANEMTMKTFREDYPDLADRYDDVLAAIKEFKDDQDDKSSERETQQWTEEDEREAERRRAEDFTKYR